MNTRAAAAIQIAAGVAATLLLVFCLAMGLGGHESYSSVTAGTIFFIAAACAVQPSSRSSIAVLLRLLLAAWLFCAAYCLLARSAASVVVFMATIAIAATVGASAGLISRAGAAARSWPRLGAGLIATIILAAVMDWSIQRLTADRIEHSREQAVRYRAPPYAFVTLDGRHVDAARLQGRVVVIDFWAAWCKPCLEEWPALDAFARRYGGPQDAAFYAIASRENETLDDVQKFLAARHYHVDTAFDADGALATAFHASGLPTMVVIDRAGNVRYLHAGYDGRGGFLEKVATQVATLLQEPPPGSSQR